MKRGVLIGLLVLFFLLCTCTVGSVVQEQRENGIARANVGLMELEANKKDEEEFEDAETSEGDGCSSTSWVSNAGRKGWLYLGCWSQQWRV